MRIDETDARIVALFDAEPRIGVLEASRRLNIARATVQSRLDKLVAGGAIASLGPRLDPAHFGYPVSAFVSLRVQQARGHEPVAQHLSAIPEVIEVHTVSGDDDLLCRVVARSNRDLQRVLDLIAAGDAVVRSSSSIVLQTHYEHRTLPALASIIEPSA